MSVVFSCCCSTSHDKRRCLALLPNDAIPTNVVGKIDSHDIWRGNAYHVCSLFPDLVASLQASGRPMKFVVPS
uniref:Uncharacterized protein n=1 Tax=Arundo donax TaxID=35708 RepID=A0A0A9FY17_ARUDO